MAHAFRSTPAKKVKVSPHNRKVIARAWCMILVAPFRTSAGGSKVVGERTRCYGGTSVRFFRSKVKLITSAQGHSTRPPVWTTKRSLKDIPPATARGRCTTVEAISKVDEPAVLRPLLLCMDVSTAIPFFCLVSF